MTERAAENAGRTDIRVYKRLSDVTTLGPGRRYCLWVQGCLRDCPGCVSQRARPLDGGYLMSPGALALEIALSAPDGITVSGGEPFLQARALGEMLGRLKALYDAEFGVIVYTGYLYEALRDVPDAEALLRHTDLLIDGPYMREKDDGRSLRGSSNQRVIPLSARYNTPEILSLYGAAGRETETRSEAGGTLTIGIPRTNH